MFRLIKNVEVYNPKYLGKKDILLCNDKIIKIEDEIKFKDAEVMDKEGFIVIPGIIDQHIHVTGGGGEGGFHTRAPEVSLSTLITSGVTTVVGLLGTDSLSKSIEDLLAKTKALKNEGITAYCLTGAYHYPSPTLTGSVSKDIAFIDEIIGLKLAISDHRAPMIKKDELRKLVSDVRVASMIANKPGILTLHMGDDPKGLKDVFDIINNTSIPIHHFRPTHVARTEQLFLESLEFLSQGGTIDISTGSNPIQIEERLKEIKDKNLTLDKVTISSDGNGSFSSYDEFGQLLKIGVSRCDGILKTIQYLVSQNYLIEDAISLGTSNVAHALNISDKKGYLKEGHDADLLILDKAFNLDTVFASGNVMMSNKKITKKGTYE